MASTAPNVKTTKATTSTVTKDVSLHQSASSATSPSNDLNTSSVRKGHNAFAHLLNGYDMVPEQIPEKFMRRNWDIRPVQIKRHNVNHFDYLKVSRKLKSLLTVALRSRQMISQSLFLKEILTTLMWMYNRHNLTGKWND